MRHARDIHLDSSMLSPLLSNRSSVASPHTLFRKRPKVLNYIGEPTVTHHVLRRDPCFIVSIGIYSLTVLVRVNYHIHMKLSQPGAKLCCISNKD